MRIKSITIVLLLIMPTVLLAQNFLSAGNNWFTNCNCTEIAVKVGDNIPGVYTKDTVNKVIVMKLGTPGRMTIDTFFYSGIYIIEKKGYKVLDTLVGQWAPTEVYTYSEKGHLIKKDEGYAVYQYQWDEKGRPMKFTRIFDGTEDATITFKYPNDTTALLEYRDHGTVIATGKRILNKRYQVVSEVLKNPSKGTEVHYALKYDQKGRLLSMQKVKVIKDEVRFFGSDHYEWLYDTRRKITFTYDSTGRMLTQTTYRGLDLQKEMHLEYLYK